MLGCEADLSLYNGESGDTITDFRIVKAGGDLNSATNQIDTALAFGSTLDIIGITDCGSEIDVYVNFGTATGGSIYDLPFPCGVSAELDVDASTYSYVY